MSIKAKILILNDNTFSQTKLVPEFAMAVDVTNKMLSKQEETFQQFSSKCSINFVLLLIKVH